MQLVEQHIVKQNSPFWAAIDAAAFASKNLYNAANYDMRQSYFASGKVPGFPTMAKRMKHHDAFRQLPAKISQQVLKLLDKSWKAYFAAKQEYKRDPSQFLGKPGPPKYKDKEAGRNVLVYTIQAISAPGLRIGQIRLSGLPVVIKTKQTNIDQVRIVPRKTHYAVEVVYSVDPEPSQDLDRSLVAGIDIGVDNLATITSNKPGFVPLLVNGRPLKSINQGSIPYFLERFSFDCSRVF